MRSNILVLAVAFVLVGGMASVGLANNGKAVGPADKVTGSVVLAEGWAVSFDAHAAKADRAVKGKFVSANENGLWVVEMDVKYVLIEGNAAYVVAVCTSDSSGIGLVGEWWYFKLVDNGQPGTKDEYYSDALLTEAEALQKFNAKTGALAYTITDGNIMVHQPK